MRGLWKIKTPSILLAAGAGFLATSLLGVVVERDREEERAAEAQQLAPVQQPVGASTAQNPSRSMPATRPFDHQPEA